MCLLDLHLRQMLVLPSLKFQQTVDFSVGHCRASQVLSSRSWHIVPDTPRFVNPDPWILSCWANTALPCPTQWHDLASHLGVDLYVYRVASGSQQAR
jgi:hypothetical protein